MRSINRLAETLHVLQRTLFFRDVAVRQLYGEAFGSYLKGPYIDSSGKFASPVIFQPRNCKKHCTYCSHATDSRFAILLTTI
jgi:hypothetical protein